MNGRKKEKFASLVLIICLIVASSSLGTVAYASVSMSFTTILEEGSNVETASYVMFRDGSTYYAKNGTTGAIDYSGSNASEIILNCVDALPSTGTSKGGLIDFKAGVFVCDVDVITLKTGITLQGQGEESTILDFSGANGTAIIAGNDATDSYFINIKDIRLKIGGDSIGVHAKRLMFSLFSNLRIYVTEYGGSSYGIIMNGSNNFIGYNTIFQPEIQQAHTGIYFTARHSANNVYGGRVRTKYKTEAGSIGVRLDNLTSSAPLASDTVHINGLAFEYYEIGLYLSDAIYACTFEACRFEQLGTAIVNHGSDNFFDLCTFTQSSIATLVVDTGEKNIYDFCYDFRTETWGNSSVPNLAVDLCERHHLYWLNVSYIHVVATPSWDTTCYLTEINSTHFTLDFGSAASGNQYVMWVARWQKDRPP